MMSSTSCDTTQDHRRADSRLGGLFRLTLSAGILILEDSLVMAFAALQKRRATAVLVSSSQSQKKTDGETTQT